MQGFFSVLFFLGKEPIYLRVQEMFPVRKSVPSWPMPQQVAEPLPLETQLPKTHVNMFDPNAPRGALEILRSELEQLKLSLGPDVQFPPNCFIDMQGLFSAYETRSTLTVVFPVFRESLNPVGTMQGGYFCAAFDNVFGPLSYLAARLPCTTLDLHTQYVRSAPPEETLRVSANVVSRGLNTMLLAGEIESGRGKLIATASANVLMMRSARPSG